MTKPVGQIPTLSDLDLPGQGVTHLRVWCGKCSRPEKIPLAAVDLSLTMPEVEAKLRCESCGHRGGTAQPDWPTIISAPDQAHRH